jgi:hypothetical protein
VPQSHFEGFTGAEYEKYLGVQVEPRPGRAAWPAKVNVTVEQQSAAKKVGRE